MNNLENKTYIYIRTSDFDINYRKLEKVQNLNDTQVLAKNNEDSYIIIQKDIIVPEHKVHIVEKIIDRVNKISQLENAMADVKEELSELRNSYNK